jgi:gluconokinase
MKPQVLIIFGPSGAGKTTVGREVAKRTGWGFIDADDYHLPENIERMRSGLPLTEAMREPWLRRLAALIRRGIEQGGGWNQRDEKGIVVACSALKRSHRDILSGGRPEVRFAYLAVSPAQLKKRLLERKDHFMPADLLESQLATLEPPAHDEPVWMIPADGTVKETVEAILVRMAE